MARNYAAIDAGANAIIEINYPESLGHHHRRRGREARDGRSSTSLSSSPPSWPRMATSCPFPSMSPDGSVPTGTTKYEKRGIAVDVPAWIPENCIQCNQCSLVCPHACIRPVLVKDEDNAPETFVTKPATGKELAGYKFRMQLSPLDCTGCGNCVDVCPAKTKALEMVAPAHRIQRDRRRELGLRCQAARARSIDINKYTVKNSQFLKPLFEFSGACAGCGETPYIKLITQLFGDRMIIANATGCYLHLRRHRAHRTPTPPTKRATVPHGPTPCLKITPSSASVSTLVPSSAARMLAETC